MILPTPPSPGAGAAPDDVVAWVAEHLGDLALEGPGGIRPGAIRGGQVAADAALAGLDVTGYARDRSIVLPVERRGATRLSPYIRHGLLSLREVWDAVADAPGRDRDKYRYELLWQEYARHLYARVGPALGEPLRHAQPTPTRPWDDRWPAQMACVGAAMEELRGDGWMVNQVRMWMASQWAVRAGAPWRAGEDAMFVHLLDGSRAANRLGWQWTVGTGSGKPYGFSRWQVEKRSPQLCVSCELRDACPIPQWPDTEPGGSIDGPHLGVGDIPGGPETVEGAGGDVVWLTAESLGITDPALAADDERPAVFVFDEPLLQRLRLSGKRLVFLAETLGDLAATRPVEVRRGRVDVELADLAVATTYAPVPGWARLAARLEPVEVHPWPWLVRPRRAPVRSYTAWSKGVGDPA